MTATATIAPPMRFISALAGLLFYALASDAAIAGQPKQRKPYEQDDPEKTGLAVRASMAELLSAPEKFQGESFKLWDISWSSSNTPLFIRLVI